MPVTSEKKSTPTFDHNDNRRDETETDQKTFDLSVTQIVGGALAAMTAAYLGSRLSVAGTVIGAAVASIVAGVGGTFYTASLRHTRDRVKSVWTGRTNATPTEVVVARDADTVSQPGTAASTAPAFETVRNDPAVAATGVYETSAGSVGRNAAVIGAGPGTERAPIWRTGGFWKRIAVGAVATFALAAATITGLELVSGQSLDGGQGTTVQRVRQPVADSPSPQPSDSPTGSPSESPSEDPSESPSEQQSEAPADTPSEEQSAAPSEAPSESGDASETPAGEAPSSDPAAPDQAEAPNADTGRDAGTGTGDAAPNAG